MELQEIILENTKLKKKNKRLLAKIKRLENFRAETQKNKNLTTARVLTLLSSHIEEQNKKDLKKIHNAISYITGIDDIFAKIKTTNFTDSRKVFFEIGYHCIEKGSDDYKFRILAEYSLLNRCTARFNKNKARFFILNKDKELLKLYNNVKEHLKDLECYGKLL